MKQPKEKNIYVIYIPKILTRSMGDMIKNVKENWNKNFKDSFGPLFVLPVGTELKCVNPDDENIVNLETVDNLIEKDVNLDNEAIDTLTKKLAALKCDDPYYLTERLLIYCEIAEEEKKKMKQTKKEECVQNSPATICEDIVREKAEKLIEKISRYSKIPKNHIKVVDYLHIVIFNGSNEIVITPYNDNWNNLLSANMTCGCCGKLYKSDRYFEVDVIPEIYIKLKRKIEKCSCKKMGFFEKIIDWVIE